MSDEAKKALQAMTNFASGTGMNAANQMSSIGSNLARYATQAGGMIDKYISGSSTDAITSAARRYADSPYLQDQIDAAAGDVRRNLTENILPSVDRSASAGGNINSSRAGIASGIAQRGAAEEIAQIGANLRSKAYSEGLGLAKDEAAASLNAANAYGQLGQQGIDALSAGTQAGYGAFDRINAANALDQQDRQGQLDADLASWEGNDNRAFDQLSKYMNIVGSNQWGQSGTSSSKTKEKSSGSILGQVLGAASTAAGVAKSFSDRRLKTNIRKVGELADGLGIYTWSYIWEPDDTVNFGVMADEVQSIRPHALGEPINGFLTVNYEKL
ncbi:tail fiber domain-containing protein [Novosphingobium panipatense]